MKNVGLPIEYEKVQSGLKNILVIGNIGNGKSTIQNKIGHMIKHGKENIQDLEKIFAAKKSIKSVTMGIQSIDINNQYRLVDSQGFGDPHKNQDELWKETVTNIYNDQSINLSNSGLGAIIIPVMVPISMRIED